MYILRNKKRTLLNTAAMPRWGGKLRMIIGVGLTFLLLDEYYGEKAELNCHIKLQPLIVIKPSMKPSDDILEVRFIVRIYISMSDQKVYNHYWISVYIYTTPANETTLIPRAQFGLNFPSRIFSTTCGTGRS